MPPRLTSIVARMGLVLAAWPAVTLAQAPGRAPEGLWQGSLQGMLRIVVHIERGPAGALTGSLDSPDQGAMGLAIDTMVFAADTLRFEMKRLNAGYVGRMNAAGDSIIGRWRQAGMELPLALGRVERAPEVRRPQEPRPPYPYDTVAVAYQNSQATGVKPAGTLTVPRGAGPFPAALLITGSGPEDRNETVFGHRPFLVLADHLTRNGIAVLRVDDAGWAAPPAISPRPPARTSPVMSWPGSHSSRPGRTLTPGPSG